MTVIATGFDRRRSRIAPPSLFGGAPSPRPPVDEPPLPAPTDPLEIPSFLRDE